MPSISRMIGILCALGLFLLGVNSAWTAPGDLDPTFAGTGKKVLGFGFSTATAVGIGLQSDGKIVVAGYTQGDFGVARFAPDGSLDSTFDADGYVTAGAFINDVASAVALQPDGKIVVAGTSGNYVLVMRFRTNGALDPDFSGGIVGTSVAGGGAGRGVAVQSNGKIAVGGFGVNETNDFAAVRYNPDGTQDATFDNDGVVTTPVGSGQDFGLSVGVQSDGKVLVAGWGLGPTDNDFGVVRYKVDGSPDSSFDFDGKVLTPVGASDDLGRAMVLQTDGKIVVAGASSNANTLEFALVRYNMNGSLDSQFDGDGIVTTTLGSSGATALALAMQTDGKILAAGYSREGGGDQDFAIVRYNPDGSLDASYGVGGKVILDIGNGEDDVALGMAVDASGKAVVTGTTGFLAAVIRLEGGGTVSSDPRSADLSGELSLLSAPNPTVGGTLLRFHLPHSSQATITIYDATGRRVRTLMRSVLPAGEHVARWDLRDDIGRASPAGVYFAELSAEGSRRAIRIVALQ